MIFPDYDLCGIMVKVIFRDIDNVFVYMCVFISKRYENLKNYT